MKYLLIYLILVSGVTTEKFLLNDTVKTSPYVRNVTPSPVSVFIDENILLSCEIGGSPTPKIKWYKYDVLLNETQRIKFYNNSRNIEIFLAEFEDSGQYECIGSNVHGQVTGLVSVVVNGAPVIVDVQTSPFIVEEGSHFDIFCYADGNPYPTVSWTRDSKPVILNRRMSYTDRNQVLNFSPGYVSDSGMYQCNVKNTYGTDRNEIEVIVGRPPKIKWVSHDKQIIALGDTVTFYCDVDGLPTPNITWVSNDGHNLRKNRVVFHYGNTVMSIKNVINSDSGSYTCKANNVIGEDKKNIDLYVVDGNDVQWLAWSIWQCTACSGTCADGGGTRICRRRRSCIGTVSAPNVCTGVQEELEQESCNVINCSGDIYSSTTVYSSTTDYSSTTVSSGAQTGSSVGIYAGIAVGAILVLVVVIIVILLVMKRQKSVPESHEVIPNKAANTKNQNSNRRFNEISSRRASGVYDQLHEPGMDENVYSTIDDYGKYTEIKELPEDSRPKYLELIDGKAVYNKDGIDNGAYQISGSEKSISGHGMKDNPSTGQPATNQNEHAYFVLEKQK